MKKTIIITIGIFIALIAGIVTLVEFTPSECRVIINQQLPIRLNGKILQWYTVSGECGKHHHNHK